MGSPQVFGQDSIPPAPTGLEILAWIGPGIVWMIAALGTGELIFTPRIASLYGYEVLWMMVAAIFFKALIAREIGRYAVVTGGSILHGIKKLPGPKNWGVWAIVLPQLLVAASTIAGLAGSTGSAVILLLPGDFRLWGVIFIIIAVTLVLLGKYQGIERISLVMSAIVTAALVFTAALLFPGFGAVFSGLIPRLPVNVNFIELLPWLGFLMSGAAGLIWYSYWIIARGYGAARPGHEDEMSVDPSALGREGLNRLKGWIRVMTLTITVASSLILLLLVAMLILGSQLLRPEGLVPVGPEVTAVLSRLLSAIWGMPGAWLMVLGAFFSFFATLVTNIDGWGRMLSQGSVFIGRQFMPGLKAVSESFYRYVYILVLMGLAPAVLFFILPEPVRFLTLSGSIEAVQIPLVALAVLYLNARTLPRELRPSGLTVLLIALAAVFFIFFAAFYLTVELL
jgi:Mn2+/Fe2+ NRAMP family transporter